jgi:hypothetical protein
MTERPKTVAILTIAVVAIASALAGAAVDRAYMNKAMRLVGDTTFHPISSALRAPTADDRKRYLAELSGALSLTPDQNRLVDSILASRAGEFDAVRSEMRPRVDSLLRQVRSDVEGVLTPEQRERYRSLQAPTSMPRR